MYVWGGGDRLENESESRKQKYYFYTDLHSISVLYTKLIMNEEQKENPSARENWDIFYFGFILFFAYFFLFD